MSLKRGTRSIVDRYQGERTIAKSYQGENLIFDAYSEVTGSLPLTFNSRAEHALKDYSVYGTSSGSGVETENLFDKDAKDTNNGYANKAYLDDNGDQITSSSWEISEYIAVSPNTTYTITNVIGNATCFCEYDENKQYLSSTRYSSNSSITFTTSNSTKFLKFSINKNDNEATFMLVPGSTAPTSYIPYGYKIPILNTSGVTENLLPFSDKTFTVGNLTVTCSEGNMYFTGNVSEISSRATGWKNLSFELEAGTYTTKSFMSTSGMAFFIRKYDDDSVIKGEAAANFTLAEHTKVYLGLYLYNKNFSNTQISYCLVEGSTVPDHYIPHRYTSNYDLMIGSTKLGEEEYVDYAEQKVYKMVSGILTPVDPPVPLPAINAYKGENTLSSTESVGEVSVKGRIRPLVYGWHVDTTVESPFDAITYLQDAIGKQPAAMGSTDFDYGDWEGAWFMPKPCMLNYDCTVAYYLDPNDYSKKLDGTPSDVGDLSFAGNAMVEWPIIWYKFVPDAEGDGYSFFCSYEKIDDDYKCWSNINANNEITDHFYTPIYNGIIRDNKLRSMSGFRLTPTLAAIPAYDNTKTYTVRALTKISSTAYTCITPVSTAEDFDPTKWQEITPNNAGNTTGQTEVNAALAMNTTETVEWYTDVWADRVLINALLVLVSKSLGTQSAYGRGLDSGSQAAKEAYVTGSLDTKGQFWGNTAAGTQGVKVFGMENWWACVSRRTAGLIGNGSGGYSFKMTYNTADGSEATAYNSTGTGYIIAKDSAGTAIDRPASGYVKKMAIAVGGCWLPKEVGGAAAKFYEDYWYSGAGYLLAGGYSGIGASCGCWCLYLGYSFGYSHWNISAAPSAKSKKRSRRYYPAV